MVRSAIAAPCAPVNGFILLIFKRYSPFAPRSMRLPADQGRRPGEAPTHGFQQHQVPRLDAAVLDGLRQRERDRGRRRVGVMVNGGDDFLRCDTKLACTAVDNPLVGLMW